MTTFTARYHGPCATECGNPIEPGDRVHYDDHGFLMHVDCTPTADAVAARRPVEVCTTCWLTKPCDCEDPQ
jgi:hypothetical protein